MIPRKPSPESPSDAACGCVFWLAVALAVVALKLLWWRAFIHWSLS